MEVQEAAVAAAIAGGEEVVTPLEQLQAQQNEQALLIQNMQATISHLTDRQSELEQEIGNIKEASTGMAMAVPKAPPLPHAHTKTSADVEISAGGLPQSLAAFDDSEVDRVIEARRQRKAWPLKRKYCSAFTQEVDLLKIRCHKSEKYAHKAIRIPKVEKSEQSPFGHGNKEGRLICRLCSGNQINRNTSWMCGTCLVPLCIDIVNGDTESSCHARWHLCQDLTAVNNTLNAALRERRESKKRSRGGQPADPAVAATHALGVEL